MNYWKSLRDKLEDKQILQPLTRRGRGSVRLVIVKFVWQSTCVIVTNPLYPEGNGLNNNRHINCNQNLAKIWKLTKCSEWDCWKIWNTIKAFFFHRNNIANHTTTNIQYILMFNSFSQRKAKMALGCSGLQGVKVNVKIENLIGLKKGQ